MHSKQLVMTVSVLFFSCAMYASPNVDEFFTKLTHLVKEGEYNKACSLLAVDENIEKEDLQEQQNFADGEIPRINLEACTVLGPVPIDDFSEQGYVHVAIAVECLLCEKAGKSWSPKHIVTRIKQFLNMRQMLMNREGGKEYRSWTNHLASPQACYDFYRKFVAEIEHRNHLMIECENRLSVFYDAAPLCDLLRLIDPNKEAVMFNASSSGEPSLKIYSLEKAHELCDVALCTQIFRHLTNWRNDFMISRKVFDHGHWTICALGEHMQAPYDAVLEEFRGDHVVCIGGGRWRSWGILGISDKEMSELSECIEQHCRGVGKSRRSSREYRQFVEFVGDNAGLRYAHLRSRKENEIDEEQRKRTLTQLLQTRAAGEYSPIDVVRFVNAAIIDKCMDETLEKWHYQYGDYTRAVEAFSNLQQAFGEKAWNSITSSKGSILWWAAYYNCWHLAHYIMEQASHLEDGGKSLGYDQETILRVLMMLLEYQDGSEIVDEAYTPAEYDRLVLNSDFSRTASYWIPPGSWRNQKGRYTKEREIFNSSYRFSVFKGMIVHLDDFNMVDENTGYTLPTRLLTLLNAERTSRQKKNTAVSTYEQYLKDCWEVFDAYSNQRNNNLRSNTQRQRMPIDRYKVDKRGNTVPKLEKKIIEAGLGIVRDQKNDPRDGGVGANYIQHYLQYVPDEEKETVEKKLKIKLGIDDGDAIEVWDVRDNETPAARDLNHMRSLVRIKNAQDEEDRV